MFKLEKQKDKAVLTVYGYVGGYYLDYRTVANALDEIKREGFKKLDFRLHTYGGSVINGNLIYNYLAAFDGDLDIYIDGVAASMGAVIMLAGGRIHMAENALVMVHAPSGWANGNAADMESAAALLRKMEKNFKKKLKARCNADDAQLDKWMDGTDYWFDADEAIEMGLADSKFEAKQVKADDAADKKALTEMGAEAVFKMYTPITTTGSEMNKEDLIARYKLEGVTAESTEEEVMAAMDAKMNGGGGGQEQGQTAEQLAVEVIVDAAIDSGKITRANRAKYLAHGAALGAADLKEVFADMKAYRPITPQAKGKGSETPKGKNDRTDWGWEDYQEKDPKALDAMRTADFKAFAALYEAEFGEKITD